MVLGLRSWVLAAKTQHPRPKTCPLTPQPYPMPPFKELSGSPHESFGPKGMTAERWLICAWSDRRLLVQELLGDGYELGGSSPVNYPDAPNIVVVRVEVEPLTDDLVRQDFTALTEGLNAYQGFAKLTVHYQLLAASAGVGLPQEAPPNTFLTYELDRDTETIHVSGDALASSAGVPTALPIGVQADVALPVTVHRLTWHRVASPPWTAIRTCQGAVNQDEFLGVEAGQLLFDGAKTAREFVSLPDLDDPQFGWQLEYRFREKPLVANTAGVVLPTADFSTLLRLEE